MVVTVKRLQELAKASPDKEICGVISEKKEIYPITNVSQTPSKSFAFSRKEYFALLQKFRQSGEKILCLYHSHPGNDPTPSTADIEFSKHSKLPQIVVTANSYRLVEKDGKTI